MKGDFTRRTFRAEKHYRTVLMQQGRVQLDSDWNEQHEIQRHHDELAIRDTVGASGAPMDGAGFAIEGLEAGPQVVKNADQVTISQGRYYVDGILCENHTPLDLFAQPDLAEEPIPTAAGNYVAYLDVWREHVTALEEPTLLEPALGGIDTGTRIRTVWQVRLEQRGKATATADEMAVWKPTATIDEPVTLAARAPSGYRRPTNQLYRVQIHTAGTSGNASTFLWSRENGAIAAVASVSTGRITLESVRPEALDAFAAGNLVEVNSVGRTRRGLPGFLATVNRIDGATLVFTDWLSPRPDGDLTGSGPVIARRWDCAAAVPVQPGWQQLEDGIEIQFSATGGYRTGHSWTIPARTAAPHAELGSMGDIEWPAGPAFRPPEDEDHHYAALALLKVNGKNEWSHQSDLRRRFLPLSDARPAPLFVPADGIHVENIYFTTVPRERIDFSTSTDLETLSGGITIELDAVPRTGRVPLPPMITVTLDVPHLTEVGENLRLAGTRAFTLDGQVSVSGQSIQWMLNNNAKQWVGQFATSLIGWGITSSTCSVRVHSALVIDGSDPPLMLNGFARTTWTGTKLSQVLPTVNDVHGADYTVRFSVSLDPPAGQFDITNFDASVWR
ncbi:DUF6519 domain-containing protein [Cryptosporangium sp. NPDC048952]|uniref:DUF6519 domain-containing protein n=1 Tax=Cryptosporangium sp. NPDC048952 TaxID=3363961 RepID=UPI00371C4E08